MAELNIIVGGEAGQGVQSVGFWLAKVFARAGYHVFADQDYESRIRGGHNFFRVRVGEQPVGAITETIDVLISLNEETIDLHLPELTGDGVVIFDADTIKKSYANAKLFNVPMVKLAEEKAGNNLMTNTVALGAALGLLKCDFEVIRKVLIDQFGAGDIGEGNVKAAQAGFEHAQANYKGSFQKKLTPPGNGSRMLLSGSEAIALGALAAGCNFMSAYPMTPTTPILEYLAAKAKDFNIVVVQPEDEISAINMTIGAAYAGARAMTATSGSGFCLMVEGIGLAGITETGVVIIEGQRPGPAVGLPTRTEQGDLQFVLNCHQGDFPRAILAPADVADSFWLTVKAFNLAEKYQTPVIVMTDHYLSTVYATVDRFDLTKISIDRGLLYSESNGSPEEYKRHLITPSGISPRAFPGMSKALVITDADEHNETGHLIEDARTRKEQMDKRQRKLIPLQKEIAAPLLYGNANAETTLIGWGSTCGALKEAVDILNRDNVSVNLLHFTELWPFPGDDTLKVLEKSKKSYVVESNATGQLARLIRQETGKKVTGTILKYDGRPFTPAYIVQELKKRDIS